MEYDIESILEMYEDDYNPGPRPMNQGPRNMYNQGSSVDHAVRTMDPVQDSGHKIDQVLGAYRRYRRGEKNPRLSFSKFFKLFSTENFSEGGRTGFMEGKLVKQGPNTGKWVVRDLYSRGDKRGSTVYFNSETEASKAISDRKTETGKQQTNAELTKKYKSLLKKEGYKSWADAPKDVKKLLKNRMSSPIKVGPSKIKEKTIKLLEEKKPINPKTGLPYTQEEYIKLTTGQKSGLSARLRGKKQKGQYQKRQGYYPEKEGNRLINYMKKAAQQQGKLPIKDRTYTNVFVDDKFVGVNDIKNNKLYTHIDYDLSKDGAKKGTVITKHPGYEGLDTFFKAAKKFKYESPDKLLGSYFSKYERVPTYNEMYNFFTVDRDAPVKAFTSNNGLTIHHQDVIAKNPTSNFQLLTTKKNTEANTIMNRLKRGEITEAKANYDLNKIGANQEGYGVSKEKITPGKGLGVAKREAVKLFKDAYKFNPNVVEDITQKLGILGCPKGLQAASGGRIKFSKGTSCTIKGRKKLEQILLKGAASDAESSLANNILKAGKGLKNMASLKNLFGPAALAFGVATEAGFVGYDMLASGKPFKQAVGDSLFNYMLGDKTKIDSDEVRLENYRNLGIDTDKIIEFENGIKEIGQMNKTYGDEAEAKNTLMMSDTTSNPRVSQAIKDKSRLALEKDYKEKKLAAQNLTDSLNKPETQERFDKIDFNLMPNLVESADQRVAASQAQKPSTTFFNKSMQTIFPATNFMKDRDKTINYQPVMQEYYRGQQFNEGGIASLMKKKND